MVDIFIFKEKRCLSYYETTSVVSSRYIESCDMDASV